MKTLPWNVKLHYNVFLRKLKQKNFFNQNEYNCILLVMLLLVSMALLKCTKFPLVIHFLNIVQLFHLQVLLIIILPASFAIFFHPYLMITLAKTTFLSQIKNANLSRKFLVSYHVTSLFTNILLQETIDKVINLIFNQKS